MMRRPLQLDMDGVLVDFHRGIAEINNRPIDWAAPGNRCVHIAMDIPKPWYAKCDIPFWTNLPKMPDADLIINLVCQLFRPEEIFICTAFEAKTPPEKIGECIAGKIIWLKRHYPHLYLHEQVVYTNAKHATVMEHAVMLDDADHNIDCFRKHGGKGVLVPRIWNSRHELANQAFSIVERELRLIIIS